VDRGIDGDLALPAKDLEAASVIAVLVRKDDGTEAVGLDPDLGETCAKLACGKSRIDKDTGVFVADEGTVARTAATEDRQMEHREQDR
jgi:hypothetical protein